MRWVLLLGVTLAACPAIANEDNGSREQINARCAAEWPGDFAMQEYCQRNQVDAILKLRDMMPRLESSGEFSEVAVTCFSEWSTSALGSDWQMVHYCIDRQLQAYDRMSR